jgi:hypothetical protein
MMMMIMDHRLNTEVPLDLPQGAEKGLDHDGPHRPITIYVSFLDVNGAIRRNGAIDIAKEANRLNIAIEEANGLNEVIKEITDPMNID